MNDPINVYQLNSHPEDNPHVTLFIGTLEGGGAERLQINLAKYFVERGMKVDLVVCKYVGALKDNVPEGVRLVSLDAKKLMLSLPQYLQYLKKARPQSIISSVERPNIIACFGKMLTRHRHKLYVRVDNSLFPYKMKLSRWFWIFLVTITYWRANGLIAISKGIGKQAETLPFIKKKKIFYIYNPVLMEDFYDKANEMLPTQHHQILSHPYLLGVGRLTQQKDFPTLLKAFAEIKDMCSHNLVILGEGPEETTLKTLARELGIEKRIYFLGFLENPFSIMKNADVFVLSSAWEGFGNVVVEALASGTSVISTDCPYGPSEILDNGKYGELFAVGDSSALARKLLLHINQSGSKKKTDLGNHLDQFHIRSTGKKYESLITAEQYEKHSATGK